jgi:O-antigen/teichoic acid export membrane protein
MAFAVGQPAVQMLNLLTGFFLLRWLSKEEFAMFGLAFAFQSTINQLTDLGFSGSIVALAGERGSDPAWLGRYLRTARHYRAQLLTFTLLGAAVAFPLLTWRQEWGGGTKLLLFGAIALSVIFQGWMMYGSPLLVHRRLVSYYRPQIFSAALRLGLCLGLQWAGLLSGWTVAWLGALAVGFVGISYRRAARDCVQEPVASEPEVNREMRRYLAPLLPGVVFAALQGQITVGIITLFGSTDKIAEVSALGRIGQLFLLLSAFNAVMVEPYIARVPASLLPRRYAQILISAILLAAVIGVSGFLFPSPLLWLLGPKYAGLGREVGWMVLTACVGYVSGVMWTMHAARRWIFWWGTVVYIVALVVVQAGCALTMDLSRTMPVIWFGLATALAAWAVHGVTGIYALWRKPIGRH